MSSRADDSLLIFLSLTRVSSLKLARIWLRWRRTMRKSVLTPLMPKKTLSIRSFVYEFGYLVLGRIMCEIHINDFFFVSVVSVHVAVYSPGYLFNHRSS